MTEYPLNGQANISKWCKESNPLFANQ